MTAVISASPVSGYSVDEDDDSQSWAFIDTTSAGAASFEGSRASELVFPAASPSIISQGSWNLVTTNAAASAAANAGQQMRVLETPSPIMSQQAHGNPGNLSASPFADARSLGPTSAGDNVDNNMSHGGGAMGFDFSGLPLAAQHQHNMQASQQHFVGQALLDDQVAAFAGQGMMYSPQDFMISGLSTDFNAPAAAAANFVTLEPHDHFSSVMGIPLSMQTTANVEPWDPTSVQISTTNFVAESFSTPPPRSDGSSSISLSPRSPSSPHVKQEPRRSSSNGSGKKSSPQTVHNMSRKPSGVHKTQRKKASSTSASAGSMSAPGLGSGSGSGSRSRSDSPDLSKLKDGMLMFCNQTVDTWGKGGNAFGDMENIERSSQKGRKGALSEEVRANALKVRQAGACFCCHIRKVKCDQSRPCKNCVKLCTQVPEVVCWKFPDFIPYIFPDFIRGHFKKEETARFVEENVASFTINGAEAPCIVTLSSGSTFAAKLVVRAKFFTARAATSDVMRQWYQFVSDSGAVDLEVRRAAPIGLDTEGASAGSQRSELRRKVEAYADALVSEPTYVAQVTDAIRKTSVPRKVLHIVQQYARASGQAIVRRALSVYAMYYVLTRQLVMTAQSITSLQQVNPVAASGPFLTPRLLNRQIKTVVDDVMQHEVTALFDDFTKRLKQKSRAQWAPCMAAFLVFTLLMEAVETAADLFAINDTEAELRQRQPARFRRSYAHSISKGIENMPFKQFAIQFHNIYQTHSRDASAKSFNPLLDDALGELGDLDPAALDMVLALRNMLQFDCELNSSQPIVCTSE